VSIINNIRYAAERLLIVRSQSTGASREILIRISEPIVEVDSKLGLADGLCCYCWQSIYGIDWSPRKIYGMDSMQALNLASDLDPLILEIGRDYIVCWPGGEPYFD